MKPEMISSACQLENNTKCLYFGRGLINIASSNFLCRCSILSVEALTLTSTLLRCPFILPSDESTLHHQLSYIVTSICISTRQRWHQRSYVIHSVCWCINCVIGLLTSSLNSVCRYIIIIIGPLTLSIFFWLTTHQCWHRPSYVFASFCCTTHWPSYLILFVDASTSSLTFSRYSFILSVDASTWSSTFLRCSFIPPCDVSVSSINDASVFILLTAT